MNIVPQLQDLKNLIIEHTKPPVTAILLNKLSLATEQAEAHSDSVIKQDATLAKQIETIERLMKENQELIAEKARRDSDDSKMCSVF